jgi:hypothetical protein
MNFFKYLIGNNDNDTLDAKIRDVSLLDISNNDKYIWTNVFIPTKESTPSNERNSPNVGVLVGAILGSVVGVIILSIGGFLLYKRKYHEKYNKAIPHVYA